MWSSKKPPSLPRELAAKRLNNSKLMKIPRSERDMCKENLSPQFLPSLKPKKTKIIHERNVTEDSLRNPYYMPNRMRFFTRSLNKRKVKPNPPMMGDVHTVCDIDSTFYKAVEGRLFKPPEDVKTYIRNLRDITLLRANAAYLKDKMIQIDNAHTYEMDEYNEIYQSYTTTKENFSTFLNEQYILSVNIDKAALEKSLELAKMTEKLDGYSFEYVKLRNKVSALIAVFEILSRYRRFINSLCPQKWQEIHDINYLDPKTLYEAFIGDISSPSADFDNFYTQINALRRLKYTKPALYFEKPGDLLNVFEFTREQCLHYMECDVFSSNILKSVVISRDYLKKTLLDDISSMQEHIEIYDDIIAYLDEKGAELKESFEVLIMNDFQELYASYEVTKLLTCIQFTNVQILSVAEDPKDSAATLMRQIENQYLELTFALDNLNQVVVKAAEKEFYTEDIKMLLRAFKAQRSLRECDLLRKALYASFEPSRKKHSC